MSDPQQLRDLAETLDACEWEHPLGSAQLCREAAEEIERLEKELAAESATNAGLKEG